LSFSSSRIGNALDSWKWVAGYTVLILLTLPATRRFLDRLEERNLSGLLGICLLLAGLGCLWFLIRRIRRAGGGLTISAWARLLALVCLYLLCMFSVTNLTVDRIHFIEYGILGLLCFRAVGPVDPIRRRVAYAMVAVFTVTALDEGIQGVLPRRYFDIRDVVIDLLAGLLPVFGLLFLPLSSKGAAKRVEPAAQAGSRSPKPSRSFRAADANAFLLVLILLLGVLWVDRVSWDLDPLYGNWERENACGSIERMRVEKDGTVAWEQAAGGAARGFYRVRGNRLDGPLLEVSVLEAQGSNPCSWRAGEVRVRYFRAERERLTFHLESEFPFRRAPPAHEFEPDP
jgi:hypothetical protein